VDRAVSTEYRAYLTALGRDSGANDRAARVQTGEDCEARMTARIISISRFVVKGLSPEKLDAASLRAGRGIENDRRYALALADTAFDEADPRPLPKTKFLMLARQARLVGLKSRYDPLSGTLTLDQGGARLASGRLDEAAGREAIAGAIENFIGEEAGGRPRVVRAQGHRFTDVSVVSPDMMEAVSLVNLASIRALESKLGVTVDPRRFRANLLVDGLEPWAEFDWIDKTVRIGDVLFRGARRTRRCAATEVNPDTGARDIGLPAELHKHFAHADMGIYLYVRSDGAIAPGDALISPVAGVS
jgi:uncharacterized protein